MELTWSNHHKRDDRSKEFACPVKKKNQDGCTSTEVQANLKQQTLEVVSTLSSRWPLLTLAYNKTEAWWAVGGTQNNYLPLTFKTNASLGWPHTSKKWSPSHHFAGTSCEQTIFPLFSSFCEATAKWQLIQKQGLVVTLIDSSNLKRAY